MDKDPLKISIVTPVLNRVETIADTLHSVSRQSYPYVEQIVQDGGSKDGTLNILNRWQRQNHLNIRSDTDRGIYDAVNQGIKRCRGDVIGILNADDTLADPDVLSDIAQTLSDHRYDGVYGDLIYISESGRILRHWQAGPFRRGSIRWGWMPPHPTLYLRRDVYDVLGAYDSSYRIAGDYDAMLRWIWSRRIRLAYLPRVLVRMRHGGISNGSIGGVLRKMAEDHRALRQNGVGGVPTLMAKNLRKLGQLSARMSDKVPELHGSIDS